ncbi:hypothetical protein ACQPW1_10275 [Nocardia sp. CA-128927]|uniref:hypothetical protein n=1 Tax=Nocardia sp. CA-128927 TaxID=3239975 RepID=UPI003D964843
MTAAAETSGSEFRVWTVNVSGEERHDGEKPYSYVLHGYSMAGAKLDAWDYHVWTQISEEGTVAADGTVVAAKGRKFKKLRFAGAPTDVVVIDCPEFPCSEGVPFDCDDPIHFQSSVWNRTMCRCQWHWNAVNLRPGCTETDIARYVQIDWQRLVALGYQLPDVAPEENEW